MPPTAATRRTSVHGSPKSPLRGPTASSSTSTAPCRAASRGFTGCGQRPSSTLRTAHSPTRPSLPKPSRSSEVPKRPWPGSMRDSRGATAQTWWPPLSFSTRRSPAGVPWQTTQSQTECAAACASRLRCASATAPHSISRRCPSPSCRRLTLPSCSGKTWRPALPSGARGRD